MNIRTWIETLFKHKTADGKPIGHKAMLLGAYSIAKFQSDNNEMRPRMETDLDSIDQDARAFHAEQLEVLHREGFLEILGEPQEDISRNAWRFTLPAK